MEKVEALQKRPREINLLASLEKAHTVIQETGWRATSELIDNTSALFPCLVCATVEVT